MDNQPADAQLLAQAKLAGQHVARLQFAAGNQGLHRLLDLVVIRYSGLLIENYVQRLTSPGL